MNHGHAVHINLIVEGRRVPVLIKRDGESYSVTPLFSTDMHLDELLTWNLVSNAVSAPDMLRIHSL